LQAAPRTARIGPSPVQLKCNLLTADFTDLLVYAANADSVVFRVPGSGKPAFSRSAGIYWEIPA